MEKRRKCFAIMPLGKEGTERQQLYEDVFGHIIKDSVVPLGFDCTRADLLPNWGGSIPDDVIKQLREADLVVADLTDRNPNVFYEMGYRQAMNLPIITIAQGDLGDLPFNVHHLRTVGYNPSNLRSVAECKRQIVDAAILTLDHAEAAATEEREPRAVSVGVGLHNIHGELAEMRPELSRLSGEITTLSHRCALVSEQPRLSALVNKIENLVSTSQTVLQTNELGLVGAYANRKDAIEYGFFKVMREEAEGIDIVGSTIFGLRGHREATFDKILDMLRTKHGTANVRVRMLFTHWDYISFRQDQERTEKNIARYVISKELKDAVDVLKTNNLTGCLRFYKGSPTCFTIVCHSARQMLLNPYPYQAEAYNTWSIVVRETPGGIYSDFKQAHVDGPMQNAQLAVPYSEEAYSQLVRKYTKDIDMAKQMTLAELEEGGRKLGSPPAHTS